MRSFIGKKLSFPRFEFSGRLQTACLFCALSLCLSAGCAKRDGELFAELSPVKESASETDARGKEDALFGREAPLGAEDAVSETAEAAGAAGAAEERQPLRDLKEEWYVYVCGAVRSPSVVRVSPGARVVDAIALAGGLTEEASDNYVNQARLLSDGEMLVIPTKEEAAEWERANAEGGYPQAGASPEAEEADGRVNINTAGKTELTSLPGIGEAKAERIIAYREENGQFRDISELKKVNGIGSGVYESLKEYVRVR